MSSAQCSYITRRTCLIKGLGMCVERGVKRRHHLICAPTNHRPHVHAGKLYEIRIWNPLRFFIHPKYLSTTTRPRVQHAYRREGREEDSPSSKYSNTLMLTFRARPNQSLAECREMLEKLQLVMVSGTLECCSPPYFYPRHPNRTFD